MKMQKRFYYELMGIAALAILGTLLLVVAVCFSCMNPEYLSGQQQEKMILVLMIGIAAIMAFFAAIPVICKTIQIYDEKKDGENAIKDTIDEMKEYVSDKLVTIVPMLFTLIIPKYLLLIINKCSFAEIINSEVLGSDIVRILFIVISVVLAVPISANMGKLLIDDAHSARKE